MIPLLILTLMLCGCAVKYPVYECNEKESSVTVYQHGKIIEVNSHGDENSYTCMPIKEGK